MIDVNFLKWYLKTNKPSQLRTDMEGTFNTAVYFFHLKPNVCYDSVVPKGFIRRSNGRCTGLIYIWIPTGLLIDSNPYLANNGEGVEINDFVFQMLIS